MSTITCVKWSNQSFAGFWFLSNFLREEGVEEQSRLEIVKDLTQQYEEYCSSIKKNFGPTFHIGMEGENGLIQMTVPSTGNQFGQVHLSFDKGVENAFVIPF